MNPKIIGVVSIILASVVWAMEPVLARLSYQNSSVVETTGIRVIFTAMVGCLYALGSRKAAFRITRKQFSAIFYIALVGTVFADTVYFWAMASIPALNAVLIGHLQPIFIVLMGFFFLREDHLNRFDYLGILFMIVAGALVVARTWDQLIRLNFGGLGDLLALSATMAWGTTAIVARKYVKELKPAIITLYRFLIASLVFSIYLLGTGNFRIANFYQPLLGALVGAGYILYYEGITRIKAAQVSALELCAPVFAAFLAFLFLRESVTALQGMGIGLLFPGIYFLSRKE